MSRYDFSLGQVWTKAGQPFRTVRPTTWHRIDDATLQGGMTLSNAYRAAVEKNANKEGGELAVVISREVVALDGGTVPPNANGTLSFSGIDYHGLDAIDDAFHDGFSHLRRMGKEHMKKKGPKK